MLTTKDGGVPGANTPNEKAPQAANLEGLRKAVIGSQTIALYVRLKRAVSGFYIDRAIGLDSIALLILAVILLIQGVMQWLR
jgi:hypothetical protein